MRALIGIVVGVALLLCLTSQAAAAPTQIAEYGEGQVGLPHDLVAVPGDGVWFSEGGKGAIGHMGPNGELWSYSGGLEGADPTGLIVGPGGDIWFGLRVDKTNSYIGRITGTGAITLYGIAADARRIRLALGPEGNVWFVPPFGPGSPIGFVTPLGAVTQYELPIDPLSLAAGPGANMWFTADEGAAAAIGKVVLKEGGGATVTTYGSGLGSQSRPDGLTAGPDGNLWFTDPSGAAFGRVTPDGSIEEFLDSGLAEQIISGSEGNLWIRNTYGLARSTTAGVLTHIEDPAPGYGQRARDIALGPEGDLWIADVGAEEPTPYFWSSGVLGRITSGGRPRWYGEGSLPGTAQLTEIVAGTASDLWFADEGGPGAIGHVIPGEDPEPGRPGPDEHRPTGPPVTPSGPFGAGSVYLASLHLRVDKRGYLRIPVSCKGGAICAGELTLTTHLSKNVRHGRPSDPVIGSRKFQVRWNAPQSLKIRLNLRGRSMLAAADGNLVVLATFSGRLPTLAGSRAFGLRLRAAAPKKS